MLLKLPMHRPSLSPSLPLALLTLALPCLWACATTSASSGSAAPKTPSADDAARTDEGLRDVAREHCAQLANAVQLYALVHGDYPAHDDGLRALQHPAKGEPIFLVLPRDPWGREFAYRRPGIDDDEFDVYSLGPDGEAGTADDVGSWEVLPPKRREGTPALPVGADAIQL